MTEVTSITVDFASKVREDPATNEEIPLFKWKKYSVCSEGKGPYIFLLGSRQLQTIPGQPKDEYVALEDGRYCINSILEISNEGKININSSFEAKNNVKVLIPDKTGLDNLAQRFQYREQFRFCNAEYAVSFADVIAILKWLPGFNFLEKSYKAFPDHGIEFDIETTAYSTHRLNCKFPKLPENLTVKLYTQSEMQIAAYIVLLMMTKTLNAQVADTQMSKFLTSRARAISYSLGVNASDVNIPNLIARFDNAELKQLSASFGFFPQLKSCIFMIVLSGHSPATQHMRMIFGQSQMTIYSLIDEFMSTPNPTRLHIHMSILEDVKLWVPTMVKLRASYGTAWPFYKLIEPTGTESSTRNMPRLGSAALAWKKVKDPTSGNTLAQIRGVSFNAFYEDLARLDVPPECLGAAAKSYAALAKEMEAFTHKLPINWSAIENLVTSGAWVAGRDY